MTQGLLVVGLLFALGVLMVIGAHSAMRELLARRLYPIHLYHGEDPGGAPAEGRRAASSDREVAAPAPAP